MEPDQKSPSAEPTLGQRITRQRRMIFLTQAQLAAHVGVTQSAVARWESDETIPSLRYRMPLAQALVISPHILYAGVEDEAVPA